jgi:hypothetical protein
MKRTLLAVAGAMALIAAPIAPAAAAGPLLFAPMVLGHVLGAMARLATLPLLAASQIPAPYYPPQQGYYAGPQPSYQPSYSPPPAYYGAGPPPQYYAPPRRDYVPYARYAGAYGPPFALPYGGAGYRYGGSGYRYGGAGYRYGGSGYRYGGAGYRSGGYAYRRR